MRFCSGQADMFEQWGRPFDLWVLLLDCYKEKEVPFNLQELRQWQHAFLDNNVVLHVCKMQRAKSAQECILEAAPNLKLLTVFFLPRHLIMLGS